MHLKCPILLIYKKNNSAYIFAFAFFSYSKMIMFKEEKICPFFLCIRLGIPPNLFVGDYKNKTTTTGGLSSA